MSPPVFLVPCTLCERHFRASDAICPFCFARRAGNAMAIAVAIGGAAMSVSACRDAAPPAGTVEEQQQPLVVGNGPGDAAADAPVATFSPPRPIYGPPAGFPGDRIPGLRGEVAVAPVTATVPVPNADKQLAIAQPALRTCYQSGLRRLPAMTGTLSVTINVQPNGKVASASVDGAIDGVVRDCMKDRLEHITFDAPGAASMLTTQLTCTSKHD